MDMRKSETDTVKVVVRDCVCRENRTVTLTALWQCAHRPKVNPVNMTTPDGCKCSIVSEL